MKNCTKCKLLKPKTDEYFYIQKYTRNKVKYVRLMSHCKDCVKKATIERRINNPEKVRTQDRKCYEKIKNDPTRLKNRQTRTADYNEKNKEALARWYSQHKKANRAYYNALAGKRLARLGLAAIGFEKHKNEIIEIYKNCQKGYHVDHIVPLNGNNVCGLHVPWNLQYLPAKENIRKSNKF